MTKGNGGNGSGDCRGVDPVLCRALPASDRKYRASSEGGRIVSGEVVLALAYGLVLTTSGLWIWRRVIRDYLSHEGDEK